MIGRAEEAVDTLERLQPEPDPCARATWMVNRAWAMTEASAHNPAIPADKVAAAQSAAREATSACPDRHRQFIATINAAEYQLEEKDPRAADGFDPGIEAEQPGSDVSAAIWRADVLGRWSLAQQRPRVALAHFEEQSHQARAVGLTHETFRAEVGAGRALLALGRRDAAVGRFKRAQSLLETSMAGFPRRRPGRILERSQRRRSLSDSMRSSTGATPRKRCGSCGSPVRPSSGSPRASIA